MKNLCHPVDYRYGSKKMRELFSPENIIHTYAKIEAEVAKVQSNLGLIPEDAAEPIANAAEEIEYEEVKRKEEKIHHDIMSLVKVMAEKAGKWGEFIHWGLTSADIKDTTKVILARQALDLIKANLKDCIELLGKLAFKYRHLPCVGRTHGIHGNVYLFGRKFAVFASELLRNLERIEDSEGRVFVGKIAGSVGTHSALGTKGEQVEKKVLERFDLSPSKIATQVLSRDRFAELFFNLSLLSTGLEKIAVEIRNLQRTEINEVEEAFKKDQVGSSAMPHKKNPIKSENITGLARIVRSLVIAGLENNVLWHERDLSNSGSERVLFPEVFMLLSEQLSKLKDILEDIKVNKEQIKRNLWLTQGLVFSEKLTMELAREIGRQKAHELVRKTALEAQRKGKAFKKAVQEGEISKHLSKGKIEAVFQAKKVTNVAKKQTQRIVSEIEEKLRVKIKG